MADINVIRVWSYITANEGFLLRTLDYISFGMSAFLAGLCVRKPDVIVATSPQFFCALSGYALSKVRRRPFVFELRDLWPDSIIAVGAMRDSIAIRALRRLEYSLYRSAKRIVSVTQSFRTVLISNGIPKEKIAVVPNGFDPEIFEPGEKPGALLTKYGLSNQFVAAYVGTIGMAHGLEVLLECASLLRHRTDVTFMIVGSGAERALLERRCIEEHLSNVIFTGPVSKEEVKAIWKLCDVALVLLRNSPLFEHVLPSKMFEAMGMERPIILGVGGESARVLAEADAGIAVPPEDARAIAAAIELLINDRPLAEKLGRSGRNFVMKEYNRELLARRMLAVLTEATETA
jgi:glycosyltransferase involved in cell wall biosynthesis